MCFHINNFGKPHKAWWMMIDLNVNNSWPSWLRTRVLFSQKGERRYRLQCFWYYYPRMVTIVEISLGHVKILIRARYFLVVLDHRQLWTLAISFNHEIPLHSNGLTFEIPIQISRNFQGRRRNTCIQCLKNFMEIDSESTEKSAKNTQRWWKLTATITVKYRGTNSSFLSTRQPG